MNKNVKQLILLLLFGVLELTYAHIDDQVTVIEQDDIEVKATIQTMDS